MEADSEARQLVVLGCSAGGLNVLTTIVGGLPATFPAPILVAQHANPNQDSHLGDILGRHTGLEVVAVSGPTQIEAGRVYVLPADGGIEVSLGSVRPLDEAPTRPTPSIDQLLSSAASTYGEGLTAVILSGSGSDGALGARQVKAAGGTIVIQNPDTADYPSMPEAIPSSIIDIIADSTAIAGLLQDLVATPHRRRGDGERSLRALLDYVRVRGGIDFATYKPGTIMRRLQRRMLSTGTSDLAEYRRHLAENPDEFARLVSSFLIKVTEFFRDPDLFEYLRHEVVPRIVSEAREAGRELRIWSAGCATGEEAFSLGILVAEELGDELESFDVRIFATDVDPDAIAFARRGRYAASVVASVPDELRDRYFTKLGDQYEVKKQIRAMAVFGQHDLGQRAPFPRVDLALCRNVLIYFTPDLQRRALHLFAFALRDGGMLVLGKSESTAPLAEHFVLTNPRLKVYRREGERVLIPPARTRGGAGLDLRLPTARRPGWTPVARSTSEADKAVTLTERAEQLLLRLPVGIILVDRDYDIQLINLAARELLDVHGQAVGEDLIHSLDATLGPIVRTAVDGAIRDRQVQPVIVERSSITAETKKLRHIEVKAAPFTGSEGRPRVEWIVVVATDVSASVSRAQELVDSATRDEDRRARAIEQAETLATANEKLRMVNRDLATANTELRTANEELLVASEEVQAATEEVETLNEELQASNEELETLNEELQATVEELNATNEDLEARSIELQDAAAAVELRHAQAEEERVRLLAILDVIDEPILVIGEDGEVIKANEPYRRLLGDPPKTAGVAKIGGDGALMAEQRRRVAREAFKERIELDGQSFEVSGQPLDGGEGRPTGALIFRSR